jgi:hypothetical protein
MVGFMVVAYRSDHMLDHMQGGGVALRSVDTLISISAPSQTNLLVVKMWAMQARISIRRVILIMLILRYTTLMHAWSTTFDTQTACAEPKHIPHQR